MNLNPGPASTSTQNLVAQLIGAGESTETSQVVFYPASTNTQDIINAANACAAAGGGIVQLPAATITLTAYLPLLNGVQYKGAGFGYNFANQVAPNNPSQVGTFGTILQGNGTFPAFWDGKSARGSAYATSSLMTAQYIVGCGVRDIQVNNFTYGVKAGDLFEASVAWAYFENVSAVGCGWGFWFENADSSHFKNLMAVAYTTGAHWTVSSGSSLINLGDSVCERLIYSGLTTGSTANCKIRNIVFGSRQASNQNGISLLYCGGVNNSQVEFSNTVNVPSSGSSIQLTSGNTNQYIVGMPVSPNSTISSTPALNAQQIYFVQSIIDSTHLTLSNNQFASSAITFSGSGSGTLSTKGFGGLEIVGQDTSTVSGMTVINPGCESGASYQYLFQGIAGTGGPCDIQLLNSVNATTGMPGGAPQTYQDVVVRSCGGMNLALLAAPNSVDFDSSAQYTSVSGYMSNSYQQGYTGCGVLANFNNAEGPTGNGLFLGGSNQGNAKTPAPDVGLNTTTGAILIGQKVPLVNNGRAIASGGSSNQGTGTWNTSMGCDITLSTASQTFTLPAAADTFDGITLYIVNTSAGTQTIALASGNFSGVSTGTSFSLAAANSAGAATVIRGCVGATNTPYWARLL